MTSEQQAELRNHLKSFVAQPGWSTKRLAEEAEVNLNSLYTFLSNEKKRMGHSMLNRLAPVMGVTPEFLHRMAGLLPDGAPAIKSPARRKIDMLLDMLDSEEQKEAIALLETFTENRKKARKAASQRGLKHG